MRYYLFVLIGLAFLSFGLRATELDPAKKSINKTIQK